MRGARADVCSRLLAPMNEFIQLLIPPGGKWVGMCGLRRSERCSGPVVVHSHHRPSRRQLFRHINFRAGSSLGHASPEMLSGPVNLSSSVNTPNVCSPVSKFSVSISLNDTSSFAPASSVKLCDAATSPSMRVRSLGSPRHLRCCRSLQRR